MRITLCCSLAIEDAEPQLGQTFVPEAVKLGQSLFARLACSPTLSARHGLIHLMPHGHWRKATLIGDKFGQQWSGSWQ